MTLQNFDFIPEMEADFASASSDLEQTESSPSRHDESISGLNVPAKPSKKKRPPPLSVRLNEEQWAQLRRDAAEMSLNAYAISKIFDGKSKRVTFTKRDKAIASALRRLSHAVIPAFIASQILAFEEGRISLTDEEAELLKSANEEIQGIRIDLIEAVGLKPNANSKP